MKIKILDNGSIRGCWIATGITAAWLIVSLVGLGTALWSDHDMTGFVGIYSVYTGGSLSYVGIYFLKKYKERIFDEHEVADRLGGLIDRRRGGPDDLDPGTEDIEVEDGNQRQSGALGAALFGKRVHPGDPAAEDH